MLKDYKLSYFERIMIYIVAAAFIINIGCVYTHIDGTAWLNHIIIALPMIILAVLILIKKKYSRNRLQKMIKAVFLIFVYLCIYVFISKSSIIHAGQQIVFVCITIAYFILIEMDSAPYILIAYRNIVFLLGAFSLIMWLFGSVLNVIPSSVIFVKWGDYARVNSYYMLHFDREVIYLFGIKFICNRSIFTERAFSAFAFIIGLAYELFIEKNKSTVRIIILFLSVVSSFSITGLIISMFVLVLKYISIKTKYNIINVLKFMIIPVIVIVCILLAQNLFYIKMSQGSSASSRILDFVNGFRAWLQSPLFGYGYGNQAMILERYGTGYSNSLSMILTRGGIMIALLYILPIVSGVTKRLQNDLDGALFIIVVVSYFIFTAIAFTDIIIYLMIYFAYACQDINTPRVSEHRLYSRNLMQNG